MPPKDDAADALTYAFNMGIRPKIEKIFKDIETGMISPEEMRKMMEIESVKRARESSMDEDKGWNNLPGQQISRFHANLNKLKRERTH